MSAALSIYKYGFGGSKGVNGVMRAERDADGKEYHVFDFEMPKGAKILRCGVQDGAAVVWAMHSTVSQKEPQKRRSLVMLPTGSEVFNDPRWALSYVGDVVFYEGALVYHVFELIDTTSAALFQILGNNSFSSHF